MNIYKKIGLIGLGAAFVTNLTLWLAFKFVLNKTWGELFSGWLYSWFPIYVVWLVFIIVGHFGGGKGGNDREGNGGG